VVDGQYHVNSTVVTVAQLGLLYRRLGLVKAGKNSGSDYHVSGGIVVKLYGYIKPWRVQYIGVERPRGWRLLRGNHRAAAPGALAPNTAPMGWA
jgi:hypothetical protein